MGRMAVRLRKRSVWTYFHGIALSTYQEQLATAAPSAGILPAGAIRANHTLRKRFRYRPFT